MKPTPWAMRLADDLQQQFITRPSFSQYEMHRERDRQYEMALVIDKAIKKKEKKP